MVFSPPASALSRNQWKKTKTVIQKDTRSPAFTALRHGSSLSVQRPSGFHNGAKQVRQRKTDIRRCHLYAGSSLWCKRTHSQNRNRPTDREPSMLPKAKGGRGWFRSAVLRDAHAQNGQQRWGLESASHKLQQESRKTMYLYIYSWVTLLSTWPWYSIVNQLYFNGKSQLFVLEKTSIYI